MSASLARIQQWKGHDEWASAVAFSPDGQLCTTASWDKKIKFWQVNDWHLRQTLQGHSNSVYALAFDPKGNLLASGANDFSIKVWDVETCELLHTIQAHKYLGVDSLSFSPDGSLLASTSGDGKVTIWKTANWAAAFTIDGYQSPGKGYGVVGSCSVAFSPDGKSFVSTEPGKHSIMLWRTSNAKLVSLFDRPKAPVEAIAFSPDGHLLVCALSDSTLLVYKVSDTTLLARLGKPKYEPTEFKGGRNYQNRLCSLAFSHNGSILVAGGWDKSVQVWAVSNSKWKLANVSEVLSASIHSLAFSPKDEYLAAALSDGSIVILSMA